MERQLSVLESYASKRILITGASGFVGKVWLAMALARLPNIGKISVLLRGKGRDVTARFEKIISESMVFKPLHELHGAAMSNFMSERVEVIGGECSASGPWHRPTDGEAATR